MARITMSDDRDSYDRATFAWDKITHSLEPETKDLPIEDKRYFESKIKFLIGKDIRLSNIPPEHMYIYFLRFDWIYTILRYPMLFPEEYARSEISKLLSRLGIRISEEGLGWKFGPMGFQQQTIKQEVVGVPIPSGEQR